MDVFTCRYKQGYKIHLKDACMLSRALDLLMASLWCLRMALAVK